MPTTQEPTGPDAAPPAHRAPNASPHSFLDRLDRWLTGRRRWTLAVIVTASVLLRAGYYAQLSRGPCLWQHKWDQSDMSFFDSWARQIAAGDVLSRDVRMPLHGWHHEAAGKYYQSHPAELAALKAAGKDPDRELWEQWCGGGRFYQDPLYPYLLAGVYKLLGPDVRWMFLLHMLAGVLANVLIYLLARRFFDETTAVVAAALAVACGPILYYELVLVRETFISLAGLILVYMTVRAMDRRRWAGWLALGAATGAAVLLRSHFLAYLAGAALAIVLTHRKDLRALAASLGALAAGYLLAMTPLIARNLAVGAPAMTSTTAGGFIFIGANSPMYSGRGFYPNTAAIAYIMPKTGGALLPTMLETLRLHPDPFTFAGLMWRKFDSAWQWYEIPSNSCFDYYRLHSSVLAGMPVTFAAVAPLALVGLVVGWGRFRDRWPLYLLVAVSFLVLMLFHGMSRYRRPLEAAAIPLSAWAIVWTTRALWEGRRWRAAGALAGLALLGLWTCRPLPQGTTRIRAADFAVAYTIYYDPLLEQAAARGRWAQAAAIMEESLQYQLPLTSAPAGAALPLSSQQKNVVDVIAQAQSRCAQFCRQAGQAEAALEHEARAKQLARLLQAR